MIEEKFKEDSIWTLSKKSLSEITGFVLLTSIIAFMGINDLMLIPNAIINKTYFWIGFGLWAIAGMLIFARPKRPFESIWKSN